MPVGRGVRHRVPGLVTGLSRKGRKGSACATGQSADRCHTVAQSKVLFTGAGRPGSFELGAFESGDLGELEGFLWVSAGQPRNVLRRQN